MSQPAIDLQNVNKKITDFKKKKLAVAQQKITIEKALEAQKKSVDNARSKLRSEEEALHQLEQKDNVVVQEEAKISGELVQLGAQAQILQHKVDEELKKDAEKK